MIFSRRLPARPPDAYRADLISLCIPRGDDALMQATSDVTEGLRRTLQLMQQEVDRSMTSNELLGEIRNCRSRAMASEDFRRADSCDPGATPESQTQTMQLTSNQYSTLSSLMNTSKSLITTLERSNILDRLVLFGAFAFFVAVCAHIFKKRVIDRGVHVVGALGGIVAKGGNAIAGVAARRGTAAEEVAQEAKGVVIKQGVADEWAKATAVAAGAAGAIRAGIDMARRTKATQALHERNVPTQTPSRSHEEEEEAAAELANVLEAVLPEGDDEAVVVAPVEVHEAVDDAGEPLHVFDEEMGLDEPIIGAAPTGEAFEPAAVEPLDEAFEEEEEEEDDDDALGFGIGEEGGGDADLEPESAEEADSLVDDDDVQAPLDPALAAAETEEEPDLPLAHDVETVALRQPHPPTPSLPDLPDLAFETPAAEGMPVQKPDLEEAVQAAEREEEEEEEDGEEIASPSAAVDSAPASSDEAERAESESDAIASDTRDPAHDSVPKGDSVEPLDLSNDEEEIASADEQSRASAQAYLADLPTDYSDLDLEAAPLRTVPVQSEEDSDTQLPPLGSTEFINEGDEVPREVAGVDGITIPLDVLDEADAPPALDVEGTGKVAADASLSEEDRSVELPIDYAAEQTTWTDEAREGSADADRSVKGEEEDDLSSSRESYEPREQADEALLEELLERQMGGIAGGAYIPAYASFNETAAHEDDTEAVVSPPDAVVDESAEITPTEESFHDSTPQSDSADEPSRDPHVTELTTDASAESDVDRTEVHIDPTEGLEVLEAIETSTIPSTIDPTAAPTLTRPPAVPESTPLHGHSHGEDFDAAALDAADAALDEEEEPDELEADAADPEPLPSLPTQTAPDMFDPEATELTAVAAGYAAQHRPDETDEEDSPSTADAPSGIPTSVQSSPTVAHVDVEQVSSEDSESSFATQPPPIPDHPIIVNPKAAVEANVVPVDVLESALHAAPEPATLEAEPSASTSDNAAAAPSSVSEDTLLEQDDESVSAFEAPSVEGEDSEVSPTEDEASEASDADFEGSTASVADESGTNDDEAEEEEEFDEEFDEEVEDEEVVVADDAHAAPVHVEL